MNIKNQPVWKKILFAVIAVIVVLRIIYIVGFGELRKEYYRSTYFDMSYGRAVECDNIEQIFTCSQDRLNSIELFFDEIADDKKGLVTMSISSDGELIYQTGLSLENIENRKWKKVYVNIPIEKDRDYSLNLSASDECTQIPKVFAVDYGISAKEAKQSKRWGKAVDGHFAVSYGYLQTPSLFDRLLSASLWLCLLALAEVLIYWFEVIRDHVRKSFERLYRVVDRAVFVCAAELILSAVLIESSGLELQSITKITLIAVSLISVIHFREKQEFIEGLLDKTWKKAAMILLYLYAAFALVGQRIFIYPLSQNITAAGLCVYAAAVIWFVPVINSAVYLFEYVSVRVISGTEKKRWNKVKLAAVMTLLLLVPAAINLYANNPGISTPDTYVSMVMYGHHLHGMVDWHPAFYCMMLGLITKIWDSTYAVILVQYFFWTYVMLEMLFYLREKGFKDSILLVLSLLFGFNVANFMHLNTIWKDIPYTLSIMWAVLIFAKLTIDPEKYKGKWYIYAELVFALVGIYLYRKNGIVAFVVIAVFAVLVLRKNFKVWCSLALSVALILFVKYPVYSFFEVKDMGRAGMYIGLSQDILGVYYDGGDVSEETLQMINVITDYNNDEFEYTPTFSEQSYNLDVPPIEFIGNYLDTFFRNPVLMTRAVIDREDAVWDIFKGEDSILSYTNCRDTADGIYEWNDYYPTRKPNSFTTGMNELTEYSDTNQVINAVIWRNGLLTLLSLAAIMAVILKKKEYRRYITIIAPVIGHILSLMLSTGWSSFRYFWPINAMNSFIILFAIVILSDSARKNKI